MPKLSGSFSGNVTTQSVLAVPDQQNHELHLVEVSGTQKSADEKWNNTPINYWGTMDMVGNTGSQNGYFVNEHGADGRDWGTFHAKVTVHGGNITMEGEWKYTGGSGKFKGITGGGTFKNKLTTPREVECKWEGAYEIAMTRAHGH